MQNNTDEFRALLKKLSENHSAINIISYAEVFSAFGKNTLYTDKQRFSELDRIALLCELPPNKYNRRKFYFLKKLSEGQKPTDRLRQLFSENRLAIFDALENIPPSVKKGIIYLEQSMDDLIVPIDSFLYFGISSEKSKIKVLQYLEKHETLPFRDENETEQRFAHYLLFKMINTGKAIEHAEEHEGWFFESITEIISS